MNREQVLSTVSKVPRWRHRIELPCEVTTPGWADTSTLLANLNLPLDLTGKTVLDVGCSDGLFSFECERRGAKRVLAIDNWSATGLPSDNGFRTAHALIESRVEYLRADLFDITPEEHGRFDLILFLGVLYHLRHPLLGLERIAQLCNEQLIVETLISPPSNGPYMQFSEWDEYNQDHTNWWAPSLDCVVAMLRSCGFSDAKSVWTNGDRAVIHSFAPRRGSGIQCLLERFGEQLASQAYKIVIGCAPTQPLKQSMADLTTDEFAKVKQEAALLEDRYRLQSKALGDSTRTSQYIRQSSDQNGRRKVPMSHREKHMQGLQLCQEGQAQEALNLLGQALNEKETSECWNDWAVAQFSCDCVPEAERGFRRALELDPQNTQAALNLGILLAELKQYSEAIPFLENCTHGINNAQRAAVTQILAACHAKQAESGKDTHDHLPSTPVRPATGPRLSLTEEFDPSSQIQGTRRKRIVFTGDLFRIENNFNQVANIRSLYNLLNYPVSLAVKDATIEMVLQGSQRNAINRSRIYELNGLSETLEGCLTLTGAREISESSAALLKTPFAEAVVFGLEMPDFLLRFLNHCGIPYLDFIIHPVRFLDDIFFGIRTNIPDAFTALKMFACNEEVFRLQAQIHKATLQRQGLPKIEENACLFIEPQRGSPWLVEDERPHGVVDFADEIQRIAGQYDTIYFRPHPYFQTTEKSTLDTLRRAGRVVIPDCNLYSLLAHDNIKEVIGVTSSVLYEAQYFGKKVTHLLKKKRFKFYGRENTAFDPWTYVAIYDAFYNPRFWAEVLKSVCGVSDCPEINLPRKASRLRTSFQAFWNYNQLDAVVLLKHLKATSEFDFCNHDLQQQQLTAGRSPAINGDALKEVLSTLTQHAKAIQLITELVRALRSRLDEMAGHTPAEPNQTSARPVPLS